MYRCYRHFSKRYFCGCLDVLAVVLEDEQLSLDRSMLETIKSVIDDYEYVFIDALPVGEDAEVLELNKITDAAVFTIAFNRTYMDDIDVALSRLNESGIPVIGGIVNFKQDWRNIMKEKSSDAKHLFKKNKNKKDKKKTKEGSTGKKKSKGSKK